MNGLHLTADLRDCDPAVPALTDVDALRDACLVAQPLQRPRFEQIEQTLAALLPA